MSAPAPAPAPDHLDMAFRNRHANAAKPSKEEVAAFKAKQKADKKAEAQFRPGRKALLVSLELRPKNLIPAETVAVLSLFLLAKLHAPLWAAIAVPSVLALLLILRIRGKSLTVRIGTFCAYLWRKMVKPSKKLGPEHIPNAFDVSGEGGALFGFRWDDDLLISVLHVTPRPYEATTLTPRDIQTDDIVSLDTLAASLNQYKDIVLDGIDVISHGWRAPNNAPYTQVYESILGKLPAIAYRSVWVVLRLNPLNCPEAIEKRGGGPEGVLKTMISATSRVAHRLRESGQRVHILNAAQMNTAIGRLSEGLRFDDMTESWKEIKGGQYRHFTTFQISPSAFSRAGLTQLWTVPSNLTTVTLRLRPVDAHTDVRDYVQISGFVRYLTPKELSAPPLPTLARLSGEQLKGFLASLPFGARSLEAPAPGITAASKRLRDLRIQASGCGQLIGANQNGQAVAMALFGVSTSSQQSTNVEIISDVQFAQQVVLRALCVGARVLVHTNRPQAWQPMVSVVNSRKSLWLAGGQAAAERSSTTGREYNVLVFDGVDVQMHGSEITVIRVMPPGTEKTPEVDLALIQDPKSPGQVKVVTEEKELLLNTVNPREELRFYGQGRQAPPRQTGPAVPGGPAGLPGRAGPAPTGPAGPGARPAMGPGPGAPRPPFGPGGPAPLGPRPGAPAPGGNRPPLPQGPRPGGPAGRPPVPPAPGQSPYGQPPQPGAPQPPRR
ncbi:type VII secretion protein EccE [Segniliparus rugosus]|uniref:Type VII secretion protein EccE n=1 Tax=Segniliparus rugosus (strain ATCC BAA-974 / DSM 45345 / CCUG 50838 / CIP 108380 / JCM 13579 / CDC 945) TaxID=679197 RepID=U1M294_SEGRC|nr:type VII secretion protein EccE [Segniliparus rugosus]ERG69210.1 type VII secretion protein EccE [Segniliparus rugosus ATCC BAA-974]